MLDIEQATRIVNQNIPTGTVYKSVEHDNLFVFLVLTDDPEESGYDPFVSVNRDTGEFRDFSPFSSDHAKTVIGKFQTTS